MPSIDTDYEVQQSQSAMTREWEFHGREFVARVEPQVGRYAFTVRDLRRERPTIHGFEYGYDEAVSAVKQVMAALENRS